MKRLQVRVQSLLVWGVTSMMAIGGVACQNSVKTDEVFEPVPINELVTTISDTDASPEQLALKRKVEEVCFFKTVVKDNHQELTVDKNYFIQNNIPVSYYDMLVENMEANNKLVDELKAQGIEIDVAEKFEKAQKRYKAYIKEFEKSRISMEEFNATYKE